MGKKSKGKKRTAPLPEPRELSPALADTIPRSALDIPSHATRGTHQLSIHPFDTLLKGARSAGFADGLEQGTIEKEKLSRKVAELTQRVEMLERGIRAVENRGAAEASSAWAKGRESGLEDGERIGEAERRKLLSKSEEIERYNLTLEERLCAEETRRITEVTTVKRASTQAGYIQGREAERSLLLAQQTIEPTTLTSNMEPPPPSIPHCPRRTMSVRPNPWSSIARRRTRHSRTYGHRIRADFISRSSQTNSFRYIIPSRRTSPSSNTAISNTTSLNRTLSATVSNIISASVSLPTQFLSQFRILGSDEGVAMRMGAPG